MLPISNVAEEGWGIVRRKTSSYRGDGRYKYNVRGGRRRVCWQLGELALVPSKCQQRAVFPKWQLRITFGPTNIDFPVVVWAFGKLWGTIHILVTAGLKSTGR